MLGLSNWSRTRLTFWRKTARAARPAFRSAPTRRSRMRSRRKRRGSTRCFARAAGRAWRRARPGLSGRTCSRTRRSSKRLTACWRMPAPPWLDAGSSLIWKTAIRRARSASLSSGRRRLAPFVGEEFHGAIECLLARAGVPPQTEVPTGSGPCVGPGSRLAARMRRAVLLLAMRVVFGNLPSLDLHGLSAAPYHRPGSGRVRGRRAQLPDHLAVYRSEEHTSELQSLRHLVCRL